MSIVSERASSCRVSRTRVASIMCPLGASCARLSSECRSQKGYEEVSIAKEQIEMVVNAYMVESRTAADSVDPPRGRSAPSGGEFLQKFPSSSYRQCLLQLYPRRITQWPGLRSKRKGERRRTRAHHQAAPATSSSRRLCCRPDRIPRPHDSSLSSSSLTAPRRYPPIKSSL
jgi:hypothetical protein